MAYKKKLKKNVSEVAVFVWNEKTSEAAMLLAQGYTNREVSEKAGVSERTLYRWQTDIDFSAEVDRLSLMLGIAARAERLRMAQRVARQKTAGGAIDTDKDLLDWLKFAQSETDGIKLDLAALSAAFGEDAASLASEGQSRTSQDQPSDSSYIN